VGFGDSEGEKGRKESFSKIIEVDSPNLST
jgi:hypothetical protein